MPSKIVLFSLANADIDKTIKNFSISLYLAVYCFVLSIVANLIKPMDLLLDFVIIRLNFWQLICTFGFLILSLLYGLKLYFFKKPIRIRYIINYTIENIVLAIFSLVSYGSVVIYAIVTFVKLFSF